MEQMVCRRVTIAAVVEPVGRKAYKAHAERQTLKFNSHNLETYNTPFSIDELLDALSSSNDSAVGPDDIHYQMLKHLLRKFSIHSSVSLMTFG